MPDQVRHDGFRTFYEAIIICKGYKDWSIEFFDSNIESLTGYDVDKFNSGRMKWTDIIIEEDNEIVRKIFIQALKADKSYVRYDHAKYDVC